MKKLALILAMVCFVLAISVAQENWAPAVTLGGNATLTAGYNLDTQIFALKNAFSTDLKLTLVPKATVEKGAEAPVYGWIQLKDFKLEQADVITAVDFTKASTTASRSLVLTNPTISAKVIAGALSFQFMDEGATSKSFDAGKFGLANITDGKLLDDGAFSVGSSTTAGAYLYSKYASDIFNLTVKISNANNYCTDLETAQTIWSFYVNPSVTVAGATISGGVNYSTEAGFQTSLGAKVEYTMALTDKITFAPSVGFDYALETAATDAVTTGNGQHAATPLKDANWAVGAGLFAKWGGNDEYDAYLKLTQDTACGNTYKTGDDVKYQGGAGVSVQYREDGMLNLLIQVNEQRGDDGLVPGLGAAVAVEVLDVTGKSDTLESPDIHVGAFANYKMGTLTPYVRAVYIGANTAAGVAVDGSFLLGLGAELTSVFPNTTLYADYNAFNLMAVGTAEAQKGLISGGVKVSF